ncbi:MAG: hypothetical protein OXM55_03575 [Bdellovibrionales bacterium]|nr:hypothetical protein [Bdellovibrionales bacterium]
MSWLLSFMVFILGTIFFMVNSVQASDCDNALDCNPDNPYTSDGTEYNPCLEEQRTLESKHGKVSGCSCNEYDQNKDEVRECFYKHICTSKCKKTYDIYENAKACYNISDSHCRDSCNGKSLDEFYQTTLDAINACTKDNNQKIKADLLNGCQQRIKELNERKGAELVCPGGCNLFCQNQAANTPECAEDITTQEGYKQCRQKLNQQIDANLPQDPNKLPDNFTWRHKNEKCDLGQECDMAMERAFNNALMVCEQLKKKAELCCKDPLKCVREEEDKKRLFTNVGPLEGDISTQCLLLKQKLTSAGNLGHQLANQCRSRASSCVSGCQSQMEDGFLSLFKNYCAFDLRVATEYDPQTHTCSERIMSKYSGFYKQKLSFIPQQCEQEGSKAQKMSQNAEEILKSALSAAKCVEEARGSEAGTPDGRRASDRERESFVSRNNQIGSMGAGTTPQVHGAPEKVNMYVGENDSSFGKRMGTNTGGGGGGGRDSSSSAAASSSFALSPRSTTNSKDKMFRKVGNTGKSGSIYGGGPVLSGEKSHLLKGNPAALGKKAGAPGNQEVGKDAEKEEKDKKALRQFAKAGQGSGKDSYSFWKKLPPRETSNNLISRYGSPHDNIFKRISDRFDILCRTEKIPCTE